MCAGGVVAVCGRARETLLGVMTDLAPHSIHQLGLGLHHPGGDGVGAHLHVNNLVALSANSLGHVVALVVVLDHLAPSHALLITVSLEAGHTDLLSLLDIVQVTLAWVALMGLDHTWAMDLMHLVTWLAITGGSRCRLAITSSRCWMAITSSRCRLAIISSRCGMAITSGRCRLAISRGRGTVSWGWFVILGSCLGQLMVDKCLDLGMVLGHGKQGQAGADYENLKMYFFTSLSISHY